MVHQIGVKLRGQIHHFSGNLCAGMGKVVARFVEEVVKPKVADLDAQVDPENGYSDEIVEAARQLSELGYGALIAIERETSLQPVVQSGVRVEAEVSAALLVTIFTPRSPLHDLAVVVRGNVIQAANCLLPLSDDAELDQSLGARHRAALGLAWSRLAGRAASTRSPCAVHPRTWAPTAWGRFGVIASA